MRYRTMQKRMVGAVGGVVLAGLAFGQVAAQQDIVVEKRGARAVPVSISGFTGEVDAVVKFDLFIAGFTNVPPEQAQFLISGSNNGHVQGRVVDRISKATPLSKAYSGASLRAQAHAFSDDVVMAVANRRGVAQTRMAFKGDIDKNASEIFVADYDGANAVAITRDRSITAAPAWAPGGQVLYYTSYRTGYPDIYSHDLGSGARTTVAKFPGLNTSAAVSPDGQRVAMILSVRGAPDLFVTDAQGGRPKQLTRNKRTSSQASSPTWSPDGTRICFVSDTPGRPQLFTISPDGETEKRLRTAGVRSATEPDWSPDGRWIAFTTMAGGRFEIWMVPAGGGEAEFLVVGEDPSWAPNSRTLLFTRRVNNRRVLSLLDVPTKHVKDVQQNLGNVSQPSWAR